VKLARKLTLALVAGMLAVFAVHATVNVLRETGFAERATKRAAHQAGHVLVLALEEIWLRDGQARALRLIDDVNEDESEIRIRWVFLNAPAGDPYAPRAPRLLLMPVALGQEVTWLDNPARQIRTYIPASIEQGRPGALEISESTGIQNRFVSSTISNAMVATFAMAGVCGAMAMVIGAYFVGRPVRSLVAKARRVGAGDLTGPLSLRQRDELGVLAEEMNAMCERLAQSHEEVVAATGAKIAALEQLRHADRLNTVGKLASGIAHELGTPLNVVSGRARMIASGGLEAKEIEESAQTIVGQTQRMAKIIRQLLDFARRRGAQKAPESLTDLARRTVALLSPIADKRGAELILIEPEGEPVYADIDATQLEQALTNLVVNGIQAMPHGGAVMVRVAREKASPPVDHGGPEGDWIVVEVRDQGVGMSSETRSHVFEPFFTTKPVGEGTGLGLSVTYGIVQEHGGWIDVESELGTGSRFRVYLPAEPPPAGDA
jgi:two-component system, NtrC family, sensor kinase